MMFGGGMFLGWLVPILLLVFGGAWLLNGRSTQAVGGRQDSGPRVEKSAQEILKERYAKGEISREEFEEMGKTLAQ